MQQPSPGQFKLKRQPVALVVVADMVGYVQAFVTAFSLINGLWPSAIAAPGPLSRFLPVILCIGITICLGSVWKAIFHHIARTASPIWGTAWLLLAILALGAAIGTSGRYMAALVDGTGAVRQHEQDYLRQLVDAVKATEARADLDRPLIDLVATGAANLRGVQDGERRYGTISGRAGSRGVTDVVGREADAFSALASSLRVLDARRSAYLAQADRQISDARSAAAKDHEIEFIDATTAAVHDLKQAGAINLLNGGGGLGAGMVVDAARGPFEQAKREVDQFIAMARELQRDLDVPVFQTMTDKDAVIAYPPLAAWILAVMIESFPFFMAVALLISNLDGLKPTVAPAE